MKNRLLLFIILIISCWGLKDIGIASDYRVFFDKNTNDMKKFTQIEEDFGSSDSAIVVVSSLSGTVLEESHLATLRALHLHLLDTPHLISVTSILSHSDYLASNVISNELLEQLKTANQLSPSLLNSSFTSTGLAVRISMPADNPNAVIASANFIKETVKTFSDKTSNLRFDSTGIVMMNDAFAYHLLDDLITLVPMSNAILFLITAWLFRSFVIGAIVLFVAGLSNIISLGMATLIGIQLTPPSGMSLIIILTISIACTFHVLIAIEQQKGTWEKRVSSGFQLTLTPIFIGALTTCLGFLSLNWTDTPPYQDLGNITAFGVVTVLFINYSLLPWLLTYKPINYSTRLTFNWNAYLSWVDKHRVLILTLSIFLMVISFSLVSKLGVNDKFTDWFSPKTAFKQQTSFVSDNLTGIYSIDFILAAKSGSLDDKKFFEEFFIIASHFKAFDNVWEVRSIPVEISDRQEEIKAPEYIRNNLKQLHEQGVIDQTGKLFKMSIIFKDADSKYIQTFNRKFQQYVTDNTTSITFHGGHSPSVLFANIVQRNIDSMVQGVFIMLFTLSILFLLYFKKLSLGVAALLTNVLPMLFAFALWALLYQYVGLAVSIVAACSLGIIVDDTTHFLFHYQEHLNKNNGNKIPAIAASFQVAGQAMLYTTIALVCGFSVFCFSNFLLNTTFASLTIITFISALIFDLLILPAALLINKKGITS